MSVISITPEQFKKLFPNAKADYSPFLDAAMCRYGITTKHQQAAFLAQLAHESMGFLYIKEIASGKAYEGRKDLGNTEPGDGVKYKGRGWIQITGRTNYGLCSIALFGDQYKLLNEPTLLEQPTYAAMSAGWYWESRKLNRYCDGTLEGFKAVTRGINGGSNGWESRLKWWDKVKRVIG